MRLTLLVPGLLWPRAIRRDTCFDLPLPALSLLLGRGRRAAGRPAESWLAAAFALPAPLPAGPLRLLGDGGRPGDDPWLCLDPVHLRIEERALVLDDPARLALTADEDAALRQALTPLLAGRGELHGPVPGRWYLRLSHPADLSTRHPAEAVGAAVDPELPGGADGPAWRRLLAEAQTLLHGHPVNQAREESGRPTVNSLWAWGPGRLPAPAVRPAAALWSDDPLLRGLGALTGATSSPLPPRFLPPAGATIAHIESLRPATGSYDALAWREAARALEEHWLAPALTALRQGRLRELHLAADGPGGPLECRLTRGGLWQLWRRPLTLAELDSP